MEGVQFQTAVPLRIPLSEYRFAQRLSAELDTLRAELDTLRAEIDRLKRDLGDQRQQTGYWKSMHARATGREQGLEAENTQLRGENQKLKDRLFGRKSEKSSSRDRSNQLPGEAEKQAGTEARKRGQRPDKPGPQRRDYSDLPAIDDVREIPPDQCTCPECGARLVDCGSEDSEQIEINVRAHRRIIRRRRYRRTCACSGSPRTVTAPPAPKLIPKSRLGLSVWVEILLDKFASHRPTERLLDHWKLLDLDLSAATVTGGLQTIEAILRPLYEALLARSAQSPVSQADETRWTMFVFQDGKDGHRWWLWVFLGEDAIVYRLDPHRSHDVPEEHFSSDDKMVLVVDRYSAYKAMSQVKAGQIVLAFCWAHVRRDFVEIGKGWPELNKWALAWLQRIRILYHHQRERRAAKVGSSEYIAADQAVRQIVAEMKAQAEFELADPKLATPCRKVLISLQEHWTGLTRFVDDLRIPLDNNASERQIRGPALGRKNYYGSGSLWSGALAATCFSLIGTLRQAGLNVRKWLTWYLESCAEAGGKAPADIDQFLPWNLTLEKRRELLLVPDADDSS
jgi:transposase